MNSHRQRRSRTATEEEFFLFVHEDGYLPPMVVAKSARPDADFYENSECFRAEVIALIARGYHFKHGFFAPPLLFESC